MKIIQYKNKKCKVNVRPTKYNEAILKKETSILKKVKVSQRYSKDIG